MSKVVGRARATKVGYYPINDAGVCKTIEEGEEFDLREGHTKGSWFEVLEQPKPAKQAKPKDESLA